MFGRELLTPVEVLFDVPKNGSKHPATYREMLQNHMHKILKVAKTNIEKAQQVTASRYNSSHTPVEYQEQEKVLIRFPTRKVGLAEKLGHPWRGPYVITKKITPLVYEVQLITGRNKKKTSVHISRMKPYYDREEPGSSESGSRASDHDPVVSLEQSVPLDGSQTSTCPMSETTEIIGPHPAPMVSSTTSDIVDPVAETDAEQLDKASMTNHDVSERESLSDASDRPEPQDPAIEQNSSEIESESEESSSGSEYKTPATRKVDKQQSERPPGRKPVETEQQTATDPTTPRRSGRSRKQNSKYQALFSLISLAMVTLAETTFTRVSQVVWVPSHEKTITGLQSVTAMIKMEDPCDIFRILPHDVYPVEIKKQYIEWCESAFHEDIIKPLIKFCPDIDAETRSTNSIRLNRPKRLVVSAAIVIGVVIAVGVATLATYIHTSSTSNLQNQISIMEKKLAEAAKNLELSHKIIQTIETNIEALTKAVQENRDSIRRIEAGIPYANIIVAHLTAQLRDVKTKLSASARSWKMKSLNHLLLETLNITLPCEDDCPLSLATPITCVLNSRKRTVQISFEMKITDPNVTILKADPFKMISYKGDQVCLKTYSGPEALLLNRKENCIHPISDKAFSTSGFIASSGPVPCLTPDFTGSANRFWIHQGCDSRSNMSPLDYIQIKQSGRENHLLCPEMTISIHGTETICPDYVFSLPQSVPFRVGTFQYKAGTTAVDSRMQVESDWIHQINFIMDPPQRPLDISTNETNALLESWTTESSFQLNVLAPTFNYVPWILLCSSLMLFIWWLRTRQMKTERTGINSIELVNMVPESVGTRPKKSRKLPNVVSCQAVSDTPV
ncbi:hypothetical protein HDE_01822 [Halotydeus destructor]|nr:hypothetical protein HDE_01822 [Halotydeus destructor]